MTKKYNKYSISSLCKLVGVSRSGYYKWLKISVKTTDMDKENKIIKLINEYIYFYDNERIQIKNGMSPIPNTCRIKCFFMNVYLTGT